ncbi:MAG: class I SAM-dependent methyltransferase [Saprospiraceae bacterium]|nr:class I SAM-dependent methyltransferase [Saprospiraceae bacterium]
MLVKTIKFVSLFFVLAFFASCDNDGKSIFKPNRIEPPSIQDKGKSLYKENVGRSSWQQPELVMNKMGDIDGKVIADIGAGTGFFVLRMAYKNAKVIAIDIDPVMVNYIEAFKENLPAEIQSNISTRLAEENDPKLKDGEVDKVIIINTVSYINKLQDYLAILKKGIKSEGFIMILDYKSKIIDIPAPPLDDRVSIGKLQMYLANAGYKNIIVDDTSLEYQYIVTAEVE